MKTKDKALLIKVKLEGKKKQKAFDFINGRGIKKGDVFNMTLKKKYNLKDISDRTVSRLTLCLSILKDLEKKQTEVNSVELAK